MLNLMMLTAALSLPYESSLTNVSKILNQTENQQLSMHKSPLISQSFDKQSLERKLIINSAKSYVGCISI